MHTSQIGLTASLLAALAVTGCGGSSGSSRPNNDLAGTAAVGQPISGATVVARCADGNGFEETVTTDAQGRWRVNVDKVVFPCALQVSGGTPAVTLHSYATQTGTANITPLTDLVIAYASGDMPHTWFTDDGTLPDPAAAADALAVALQAAGFTLPGGNFDPFRSRFSATAGDPHDDLLEALGDAIEGDMAIADHDALLTLIKDGNLGSLPQAPEGGDDDIEAPEEGPVLITTHAGTWPVLCTVVSEPIRDGFFGNRDHERGNIVIHANGDIDYDTGILLTADDIDAVYDRTMLQGTIRRVHINYDQNDSGRRIDIFLNDAMEPEEIRYKDGEGGVTRAAVGSSTWCDPA